MVFVIVAMILELSSFNSELIHQWLYSSNGYGNVFFDFGATCCTVLSSIVITMLLLLMSWGWYIDWSDLEEDIDLYIPMMILVITIHMMIVGFYI